MVTHSLTVVSALLAAVFMAVGIVVRQRATIDVPAEAGVSPVMLRTLVRRPLWWAGTSAAVIGYGFQALALAHGSLILVQPLLVSALLFALPLSARLAARRVSASEWIWALLLTAALTVFVVLARTEPGEYVVPTVTLTVLCVSTAAFATLLVALAVRTSGTPRAVLLAVVVGVLFGVMAVLTKIVMHTATHTGVIAVLTNPELYLLIAVAVIGTVLQQSAFHAGALQTSVPTMLVLEPLVAVALGAVMLSEDISVTGLEAAALVLTALAMLAATVALGRGEGAYEDRLEAVAGDR
ncbi:DMT family transporter [Mycolicibacterium mengxianglii]|uniref:DMT family transporter n=1 Tax=Mycolicibacterium mengxianglii TaxID=2736649 RepID=UPI0018EF0AC7|nr:DMT family transporter [Mycolicibacterium mengxianglii]